MDVALLHYFSLNFDDAWLELGMILEEEEQKRHVLMDLDPGGGSGPPTETSYMDAFDIGVASAATEARESFEGIQQRGPLLPEGQLMQAKTLLEKIRLQLAFAVRPL